MRELKSFKISSHRNHVTTLSAAVTPTAYPTHRNIQKPEILSQIKLESLCFTSAAVTI